MPVTPKVGGECYEEDDSLVEPELLDVATAEPLLIPMRAFALKLLGIKHYVRMRRLAEVSEKVAPAA